MDASRYGQLERQRAKLVARAETISGLRDGSTYRVRAERRFVRVSLRFYPHQFWAVEDLTNDAPMTPIEGTYRKLDNDLKDKLEEWL